MVFAVSLNNLWSIYQRKIIFSRGDKTEKYFYDEVFLLARGLILPYTPHPIRMNIEVHP
jgi:hypothetical protein